MLVDRLFLFVRPAVLVIVVGVLGFGHDGFRDLHGRAFLHFDVRAVAARDIRDLRAFLDV